MRARMSNHEERSSPAYPIESVDNALRLLLLLGERASVGVSEAGEYLGVAPSTAHRLLAMLQHHGFAEQDPETKTYMAGPALYVAGLAALRSSDVRALGRPELGKLVAELDETAHLCTLQGASLLFLDCVESDKALRAGSRTGQMLPSHCTAAGRALLACLSDDRVVALFPDEELPGMTDRSVHTRTDLLDRLEVIREQGYEVNSGESEVGLRAVAAAIVDRNGRANGAITVAAPDGRLTMKDVPRVARAVRAAAERVGAQLA